MTCSTIDIADDLAQFSLTFFPDFSVHRLLEFMPIQGVNSNIFNIHLKKPVVLASFRGCHLFDFRFPFLPALSKRLATPVQNQVPKYLCIAIMLVFVPKHKMTWRWAILQSLKGKYELIKSKTLTHVKLFIQFRASRLDHSDDKSSVDTLLSKEIAEALPEGNSPASFGTAFNRVLNLSSNSRSIYENKLSPFV